MNYSWKFGEMTQGFEWYSNVNGIKEDVRSENEKCGAGKRGFFSLLYMMAVFAAVSYCSGIIIDIDTNGANGENSNGENVSYAEGAVSVFSEIEEEKSIYEKERRARIDELASSYIESYMCEKYGKDIGGENAE